MKNTVEEKELAELRLKIARLQNENETMYAALLEASELVGPSASLRCKVELQRIARNEAQWEHKMKNTAGELKCRS